MNWYGRFALSCVDLCGFGSLAAVGNKVVGLVDVGNAKFFEV